MPLLAYQAPEIHLPGYECSGIDRQLLACLQTALASGSMSEAAAREIDDLHRMSGFPTDYDRLAVVIYSPGNKRILVLRRKRPSFDSLSRVFARVLAHHRLADMQRREIRIQLDFIEASPESLDYKHIGSTRIDHRHFEAGVDGLLIAGIDGRNHYFLPGDAYVRSIMSMKQLRQYLERAHGKNYLNSASFYRFRSRSFVSYDDEWLALYRGHPVAGEMSREKLERAVDLAIGHIKLTQKENGQFLYYYDAARDSLRDHEHPGRDPGSNPYYNILRHAGGGLTCFYYERYFQRGDGEELVVRALEYLVKNTRFYTLDGEEAGYIYFNRKAKLGGSGIALYLLAEYRAWSEDQRFDSWGEKLARHVLGEIMENGEFRYYHIYLDKPVLPEQNDEYFSFYYPGEAVCGLARYYPLANPGLQRDIVSGIKKAMHFLLNIRPLSRQEHYTEVPSDSWLMMGVKELWNIEEFRQESAYLDFVFADADKMVEQMYTVLDAPYPDYAGAFYYRFGDYPYSDGARCEGLLAAFQLALRIEDSARAERYWGALKLAAWSVFHLVNTEQSIYSVSNPELSLGGIRFKYTRQWFRIDTIQHVACFFAKMLPHWGENGGYLDEQ